MCKMKTKIVCSKVYARAFRSELSDAEFELVWEKLVQTGRRFYEIYKTHISDVLEAIPKYTGFGWERFAPTQVPVYLVDTNGPSRSSPLTLKARENIEYMLTVLAHELTHINMPERLFENELQYEDVVNQVTLRVCKQIGISAGTETIDAYRKAMQIQGFESKELDLEWLTVKETLNRLYA